MAGSASQHSFSGHETFPFRYPWLKKGFDAVREDGDVFLRDDAITTLGSATRKRGYFSFPNSGLGTPSAKLCFAWPSKQEFGNKSECSRFRFYFEARNATSAKLVG
jgi:Protein of unknown function (DUF4007)